MIWFVGCISFFYVLAMLLLLKGFYNISLFSLQNRFSTSTFSIVIPFRNEAENLPALLHSLQQIQYPVTHFEIIFVNDASEDTSEEIIRHTFTNSTLPFKIVQNIPHQTSPKKAAIALAIQQAQFPWILTTDADCTVPSTWLQVFNDFILDKNPVCIAGPVAYKIHDSFIHGYQQLDNWSLQATTMGSFGLKTPMMANGANFCYQKAAFKEVHGFQDNLHIASGDDVFLLEKFQKKYPQQTTYLKSKDAIVSTKPCDSWKKVIQQRIRWASKTSKTSTYSAKILGIIVLLQNSFIVALPFVLLLWNDLWQYGIALLLLKMIVDYFILKSSAQFFSKELNAPLFLSSFFVYASISVYTALASLFGSYTWKGRSYKKAN